MLYRLSRCWASVSAGQCSKSVFMWPIRHYRESPPCVTVNSPMSPYKALRTKYIGASYVTLEPACPRVIPGYKALRYTNGKLRVDPRSFLSKMKLNLTLVLRLPRRAAQPRNDICESHLHVTQGGIHDASTGHAWSVPEAAWIHPSTDERSTPAIRNSH